MPSCRVGHLYIIFTALTKPPKEKYALCVSDSNEWFVWFNSDPRTHGQDQLAVPAGCHELIVHDSYLDLSRVVVHSAAEVEAGKEFARIDTLLRDRIVAFTEGGLKVMPARHSATVVANLSILS